MKKANPTSFAIFIAVISMTAVVFIAASLFSYFQIDQKYAMILALIQFIAMSFTTIGVYAGFKYHSSEQKLIALNRIGMIGNSMIFLFTVSIMIFGACQAFGILSH